MKGNILYNKLGTNRADSIMGTFIPILKSLKKFISSNKFKIYPKQKNAMLKFNKIFINSLARYLFITKDLIIFNFVNFHIVL